MFIFKSFNFFGHPPQKNTKNTKPQKTQKTKPQKKTKNTKPQKTQKQNHKILKFSFEHRLICI